MEARRLVLLGGLVLERYETFWKCARARWLTFLLQSSIMVALYRMVELTSGSISLDGVDISQIGLHTLRNAIASEYNSSWRPFFY